MGDPIMEFFEYENLPHLLADASKPFCELAKRLEETLPPSAELSVALRKLLEAKDAAVRATMVALRAEEVRALVDDEAKAFEKVRAAELKYARGE